MRAPPDDWFVRIDSGDGDFPLLLRRHQVLRLLLFLLVLGTNYLILASLNEPLWYC